MPEIRQPDPQTQVLRGLITHRTGLMTQRARHKNRIQSLLGRLLIHPPCEVLWTKTGMTWLKRVELPPTEQLVLGSEQRQLARVEEKIALLNQQLIAIDGDEPRVRRLMTLPGASHVVAIGLLSTPGDVSRFRDGDHAAAYVGLAPITRQSGNHCYHGRITKAGNSQAHQLGFGIAGEQQMLKERMVHDFCAGVVLTSAGNAIRPDNSCEEKGPPSGAVTVNFLLPISRK